MQQKEIDFIKPINFFLRNALLNINIHQTTPDSLIAPE